MGWKSWAIKPYAALIARKTRAMAKSAVADQEEIRKQLIAKARKTAYGKDHNFDDIENYEDFIKYIPIRDYEQLRPYIDRVVGGEADVLWPGVPKYLAKTSGTTSGVKYIPLTADSMPNHMDSASYAVLNYVAETGNSGVFDGKLMFLSGSPELSNKGKIPTGRLSGIVNHEVPSWAKSNQVPSYKTNCIEDWEQKLAKVADETLTKDMRLIGGIPPWVQMYYEHILARTGKSSVGEIFSNLSLFVYGGVNFKPYQAKLTELVGRDIDSIELYPASEGFIAYQVSQADEGMLLNTRSGIFYEFVPAAEAHNTNPTRLQLQDVELGKDYAVIINNNAGLWGYSIGDSVRFVSLDPYKLIVSGRIKHYISAFGEHVIGKEVENALMSVANASGIKVVEFTVAPQVTPPDGSTPYHEWFVEFDGEPGDIAQFEAAVDLEMKNQNIYYDDLITGGILQPLKIRVLRKDAFRSYMKTKGKLGGQNKVPRLSNDRAIADGLSPMIVKQS